MYIDQSQIEGLGTAGTPSGGVVSVQFPAGAAAGKTQIVNADSSLAATVTPYGRLRVALEGTCSFIDHFDIIDVNKWITTTLNGGNATYPSGILSLASGTTASAQAMLTSIRSFEQQGNAFLEFGCNIQLETSPSQTNVYRFWGLGTSPSGGSTYANPIQDGIGFELVGSTLSAVMYSNGVKKYSVNVTTTLPTDGQLHRYAFVYNTQFQYFFGQSLDVPIASNTTGIGLVNQVLPLKLLILNNSVAPSAAVTLQVGAIAVTDTARNAMKLADGTYPDRQAEINIGGALKIFGEGSDGRVKTGSESLLFFDSIEGTTINPNLWTQKTSGMTITQSNASQTLNANGTLTSGAYAVFQSVKYMPILIEFPLYGQWRAKVKGAVGAIVELGFMNISGNTSAPLDGCFLRWDATGTGYAVINYNGTETLTPIGINVASTDLYNYEITIYEDQVVFEATSTTVNSPYFALTIPLPGTQGAATSVTHIQACARVYNTAAVSTAASIILSGVNVQQMDLASNRSYREQLVMAAARGSYQYPVAPYTSTSNSSYNTATLSATLSATTPSYTTLGGNFLFTVPAGSDVLDYALFAFQIPTGYQFHITDITIDTSVATALAAGAILQWTVGLNSSGASLATVDNVAANTYAPRRVTIGQQGFLSNASGTTVGASASEINIAFDPGLVCDSGRYFHLILRMPVATVGGTLRGAAVVRGYFE